MHARGLLRLDKNVLHLVKRTGMAIGKFETGAAVLEFLQGAAAT